MSTPTSDLPTTSREVHLASRPSGWPTPENFTVAEAAVPELGPDQVLVRNVVMSVDPYMRGRMDDRPSYVPPFQVGAPLDGGAVGEVVASTSDTVPVGAHVLHGLGWRELAVLPAARVTVIDTTLAPAGAYLGVLGMPGLTAYAGLLEVAGMTAGDTVFVSGAAGAVGSLVGQIAKLKGAARVVGSAGSAEKVRHLVDDLGFDAAFNYKDGDVRGQLRTAAPDGIDVYFDNVGGEHLEAAISALNNRGRVAICGMISQYNADAPTPGPRNMAMIIGKRLTLRGFIVSDFNALQPTFVREMGGWLADGSVRTQETVVDGGVDAAGQAFVDLMRGANTGKMLVRF
ncbi:NADP-dependent oxidoreductase [Rhodococcus antarcticus]|jgi:NADPH-dependent curcumin reductase CurA|uniref:NADP-dependent oxidoreductase n=1 Tax=Rhodococcus antarcticus TaxID=2987751 RepID=A0ABY6NXW8_9NOCA|nr:NADP-dependent oxidoreductase [Rhodococcus antarcticus]UZJ24237.1 NADP-dependent oxidoreductase [Rhodococcus antarcticus]